jgi:hypothetical protein
MNSHSKSEMSSFCHRFAFMETNMTRPNSTSIKAKMEDVTATKTARESHAADTEGRKDSAPKKGIGTNFIAITPVSFLLFLNSQLLVLLCAQPSKQNICYPLEKTAHQKEETG